MVAASLARRRRCRSAAVITVSPMRGRPMGLQSLDRNAFPLFDDLLANAEAAGQRTKPTRCFNRGGHDLVLPEDIVSKDQIAFGLRLNSRLRQGLGEIRYRHRAARQPGMKCCRKLR